MRFLERLNRPAAAVLALALLLAVGGFLFFGQSNQSTVNAPVTPAGESFSTEQGPTTVERASVGSEGTATEETAASDETTAKRYADDLGPFSPRRSGMEQRVQECNEVRDQERCIKALVADAAPQAGYIGVRTELNKDGSERNEKVLYYEDPALQSCEFTRKEFDSDDRTTYYAVIIAGEGSFSGRTNEECVIEF